MPSLMTTHNRIRYGRVPYVYERATPTSSSYHKLTQELVNHITGFGLLLSLHEWLIEERSITEDLDEFGWFPPVQSDMIEFHVISSGAGEFDPYPYYDDDKDID